jgi:hypothetical protein
MRNCVPVLAAATFYLRRFDAIASLDLSVGTLLHDLLLVFVRGSGTQPEVRHKVGLATSKTVLITTAGILWHYRRCQCHDEKG